MTQDPTNEFDGASQQDGPQPTDSQGQASEGSAGREAAQWFYSVNGESFGPVSQEQLAGLARKGYFKKDDYVYAAYIGDWVRADSVHGLFDEVGTAEGADYSGEIYVPGAATPPGQTTYVEYAGFWIRFLAVFIDGLVLFLPNCLISGMMQAAMGLGMRASNFGGATGAGGAGATIFAIGLSLLSILLQMVLPFLYYGFMESSRWQATLGKRAVGVMVTDLYGRRISFWRAGGRNLASMISGLILLIGYIIGAFTERKQTLHDMIAGTVVITGRVD